MELVFRLTTVTTTTGSGKFLRRERRADQARRAVIRRPGNEGIYHYPYNFSIKGGTREWHKDKPQKKNFYTEKRMSLAV